MKKDTSYYQGLLERYLKDTISLNEVNELLDFIKQEPATAEKVLRDAGNGKIFNQTTALNAPDSTISKRMLDKLLRTIEVGNAHTLTPVRRIDSQWWAAAAAIVLLTGAAYFLFFHPTTNRDKQKIANERPLKPADVVPGRDGAILKLGDGKLIVLDSSQNGQLSIQGNSKIIKLDNGSVRYESLDQQEKTAVVYNTLSTPRGRKYQLTLPDGTGVWLDAASSITYPSAFTGDERRVVVSGQIYFEVAHNANLPFIVQKGDAAIKVLGTHFNVNAYDDEANMKITLLEGAINVTNGTVSDNLRPGEQAELNNDGKITINRNADSEEVMAWKNGLFFFKNADVPAVMRQISRWYDVDVVFEGSIPLPLFDGQIERNIMLSKVLENLEKSGVHFKVAGKKIVVLR